MDYSKVAIMRAWNNIEIINDVNKFIKKDITMVFQSENCDNPIEVTCDCVAINGDCLLFYNNKNIVAKMLDCFKEDIAIQFSYFKDENIMFVDSIKHDKTLN